MSIPTFVVQMISLAENVIIAGVMSGIYGVVLIGMIYYYFALVSSDPTDPLIKAHRDGGKCKFDDVATASGERPYECEICKGCVDKNAKHCKRCNRCVDHFDHHCPYVNNCVGGGNYDMFIKFISFVFCATYFYMGTGILSLVDYHT